MSNCQFKSGFFLLRACPHPPTQLCSGCGLNLCSNHQQFVEGQVYCPACIPAKSEESEEGSDIEAADPEDANPYEVRKRHPSQNELRSTSDVNSSTSSSFNQDDQAAFDESNATDFDDDDASKMDFGDS